MAYIINKTNGELLSVVDSSGRVLFDGVLPDGELNTSLGINLVGKNYVNYGELQQENFVKLLENFANATRPTNAVTGQIWYDTTVGSLKYYDGLQFRPVAEITAAGTPPVTTKIGDTWWNTTSRTLNVWSGTSWVNIGPRPSDQIATIVIKGALADTDSLPTFNNVNGDTYIINTELHVWNGSEWVNVGRIQGPFGPIGPQGPIGAQGLQGPIGDTGPQGFRGSDGLRGVKGDVGPRGTTGPQGAQGAQGPAGTNGTSVVILGTFSSDGDLPSVGNSNGDGYLIDGDLWVWADTEWVNVGAVRGPIGPQGPAGPQGDTGPEGPQGVSITLIGTVATTANLGLSGAVNFQGTTITSSINDAYIVATDGNMYTWQGITRKWVNAGKIVGPEGPRGPQGVQGAAGAQGPIGPQGPQGIPGISGPPGLTGARGAKGDTGDTGPQGTQGIQGPQGEVGPAGPTDYDLILNRPAISSEGFTGTILPINTDVYSLGSESKKFFQVHAAEFVGKSSSSATADIADRIKIDDSAIDTDASYRTAKTTATANTIAARDSSGNISANLFQGTATLAQYSDLAERFEADQPYVPGTVVKIGGSAEITAEIADSSEDVFGVISTAPAHLMNSAAGTNATHPAVAVSGRVPVRVIGPIHKGQRLISAGQGLARGAKRNEITGFNVIGRSLEDKLDDGEGIVEAIVRLNS